MTRGCACTACNFDGFDAVEHWLAEIRSLWTEQLAAFKAHVERRARSGGRR